jgi:broad specificity phosphatase PhoE
VSPPALVLVRHARPRIDPQTPPRGWPLSPEGRAAAQALARKITPLAPCALLASTEPKAIGTAQILGARLGLAVSAEAAFDEHHRESWPFEPDPEAATARVLRVLTDPGRSIDGAETGADARARFAAGLATHSARPLLVASHGTVLSLFLAAHFGLDAVDLWRGMALPEAFVLDAEGRLIDRIA